jgi:protease-4
MHRIRTALFAALAVAPLVACDGRPRSAPTTTAEAEPPKSGPALAVVDLSAGAPEMVEPGIFEIAPHRPSFDGLLRTIDRLARDEKTRGVLVRFGGATLGLAQATELGEALEALRKAKPVFCHAEEYSNATLYAAARGCGKISLSPAGGVEAVGLAAQVVYMRHLLADTLGFSIDFLQVGRFKGAEEPLTRDGPSDEARASLEGTLGDLRGSWIDGIHAGRPHADADAPEDGPYSANAAKDRGLIDEVAYFDDARTEAREAVGAVRDTVRFGAGAEAGGDDALAEIVKLIGGEGGGGAPIALVRAVGAISMGGGGGLFGGSGGITEHELGRTIARLEKDDDVKVVVLRIDSPGGSALASDLIWHALMRVRAKKPIVVSVGNMAASGGYYLASTGTEIVADPASIVGSIGVVGGKVAIGGALEKLGVHVETFPAKVGDPKAASRAAYLSLFTAWDDATRDRMLETMTSIYELFLARVVEGRGGKITLDRLKESAEGRIFSGRQGRDRGLVDLLGGLDFAIERARVLANLPSDARVGVVGQKAGFLDSLVEGGDDESEERAARAVQAASTKSLLGGLAGVAPELAAFASTFEPFASGEKVVAGVPFSLVVR